jgi:hypothetical protein
MVKFGRLLRQECVPEWSAAYVDYAGLKKLMNGCPDLPTLPEEVSDGEGQDGDEGDSLWPATGAGSAGTSRGGGGDHSGSSAYNGGGDTTGLAHTPPPPSPLRRRQRHAPTGWRSLDDFFSSRVRGRPTDTSSRLSLSHRPLITVAWNDATSTPSTVMLAPSPAPEGAMQALGLFWRRLDSEVATCNTFYVQQARFFEHRFEELLAALKRHRRQVEAARAAAGGAAKGRVPEPLRVSGGGHESSELRPPVQRRVSTGRTMLEVSEWTTQLVVNDNERGAPMVLPEPRRRPLFFQPPLAEPEALPPPPPSTTDASLLSAARQPSLAAVRLEARQLRHACRELYRGMAILLSFSRLNAQAVAKILKKHDKRTGFECGPLYTPLCDKCAFRTSEHLLVAMQRAIEREFLTLDDAHSSEHVPGASDGSPLLAARARRERRAAVLHKLRPQMPGPPRPPVLLLAGLLTGGSAAAAAFLGLQLAHSPRLAPPLAPVLRGPLLLLLNLAGHGVAVSGWSYNRISWDFIFGQTPGCGLRWDGYLCLAGTLALPWIISWCAVLGAVGRDGPWATTRVVVAPIAVLLSSLLLLLFPMPRGRLRRLISWPSLDNRLFFWHAALRTAVAPAVPVAFVDFFMADQLVSQQQCLCDLAYLLCFYASGAYSHLGGAGHHQPGRWPLDLERGHLHLHLHLACVLLPFWLRIAQCVRRLRDERRALHGTNIGKYLLGAAAAATRTLFVLSERGAGRRTAFITCSTLASTAGFLWDLRMDWGLLRTAAEDAGRPSLPMLRPNLLSGPPALYYTAIVTNLVLRFAWLITLLAYPYAPVAVATVTACLEVCRRCAWSFFRVEAEHVANTASMTAFAPIALPSAYVALRRLKAKEGRRARTPVGGAATGEAPSPPVIEVGGSISNQLWADTGDMLAAIGTPLRGDATRQMQAEEEGLTPAKASALAPRLNTQRFTSGEHFAWASDDEDGDGIGELL